MNYTCIAAYILYKAVRLHVVQPRYRLWKGVAKAHSHLLESNTHGEQLWFDYAGTDSNFWAGMHLLYRSWQAATNTVLLRHSTKPFLEGLGCMFCRGRQTIHASHL